VEGQQILIEKELMEQGQLMEQQQPKKKVIVNI